MAFNNSSCHYQEGLKVLFDGSKNFWRTRTSIDVVVALHTIHNCIEIVAFNPTLFLKAPRIYANFSTLKSHLDPVAINESLNQMKETATRLKKLFNLKDATTQILSELSLEYIFKRLDFARDCTRENFRMELKVFSGDHSIDVDGQSALDCVITCPQLLIPVTVDHKAKLRSVDRLTIRDIIKFYFIHLV